VQRGARPRSASSGSLSAGNRRACRRRRSR
jgi:hypothetical protein